MTDPLERISKIVEDANKGLEALLAELRKLDQQLSKQIKIAREVEG